MPWSGSVRFRGGRRRQLRPIGLYAGLDGENGCAHEIEQQTDDDDPDEDHDDSDLDDDDLGDDTLDDDMGLAETRQELESELELPDKANGGMRVKNSKRCWLQGRAVEGVRRMAKAARKVDHSKAEREAEAGKAMQGSGRGRKKRKR